MDRKELAVWIRPGETPRRGVVVKRGKSSTAAVTVDWESGRQEKVGSRDRDVLFAYEDSQRLRWILDRRQLDDQMKTDPAGVFAAVVRDEGRPITTAVIKKRLVELGLDAERVGRAFDQSKPHLKENQHLVIKGASHTWSDVPVDPFAHLREMKPLDALERLLSSARFKPGEKAALGDAIRSALT